MSPAAHEPSFDLTSWSPDRDRAHRLCEEARDREAAGTTDEAERLYREAIALEPDWGEPRISLGSLLGDTPGTRRAGIREVQRGLELGPESSRALVRLGSLLMEDARCAEAEPVLLRALALAPNSSTCVYLGVCAETLGRRDEAMAFYRQALDLDPENDLALYDLGCLLRFEDPPAAEASFRRALEIDPLYAVAWGELGRVLLLQERIGEALEALERSVGLRPAHHWHQLRRAVTLLRVGRAAAANPHLLMALQLRHADTTREHHECLRSALATERTEPWSRLYRAYLLGRRGDFDEALKLVEGAPDDAPLQTLTRALLADRALWRVLDDEQQDLAERTGLLELAVDQEPAHPEAWEELGRRDIASRRASIRDVCNPTSRSRPSWLARERLSRRRSHSHWTSRSLTSTWA